MIRPSFKARCFLEQLLSKGIQRHDITIKISEIKNIYDDITFDSLATEFQMLKTIIKEQQPSNTRELSRCLKTVIRRTDSYLLLFCFWQNFIGYKSNFKLLIIMGATSATAGRSFSTMRRMTTWLRSSMKQRKI